MEEAVPTSLLGVSAHTSYLLWVIIGLAVTAAFILLLYFLDRRRRKSYAKQQAEAGYVQKQESPQADKPQEKPDLQEEPDSECEDVILADAEDVEEILKQEADAWKSGGNHNEK